MDNRNLNRYFNINKAIDLYKRKAGIDIGLMELNVLLSLFHLEGVGGVGPTAISGHLRYYNRTMSKNQIIDILKRFVGDEYVIRDCGLYRLSVSGKNLLYALDDKCKETVKAYRSYKFS